MSYVSVPIFQDETTFYMRILLILWINYDQLPAGITIQRKIVSVILTKRNYRYRSSFLVDRQHNFEPSNLPNKYYI